MKKIIYILLTSSLFLLWGCGNNSSEAEEAAAQAELALSGEGDNYESQESEKESINLPSPLRVIQLFNNSGLTYESGLTSNPQNVDNYITKFKQKINFGVYTADLAYSVLNEQQQMSLEYLKTLKVMSEKLWKRDIFSSIDLGKTIESNIGNKDELLSLLSNFQLEIDKYLEMNGVVLTGSFIFAGALIEILHIGLEANKIQKNPKFESIIIKQPMILESLIELLDKNVVMQKEEALLFLDELKKVQNLLNDLVKSISSNESSEEVDVKIQNLRMMVLSLRTNLIS